MQDVEALLEEFRQNLDQIATSLVVGFKLMGIPGHRDRRFRMNVTGHSGSS